MKKFRQIIFLACGLLLTLAAFPVFAQEKVEINKMPFKDLIQMVGERVESGKVDLNKSFSIEIEGALNKDGRLEPKQTKLVRSAGDAAMIEIAKNSVEALSNSGLLMHLRNLGAEKINFALAQDEKQLTATIKSEVATADRAKSLASLLNNVLMISKVQSKDENARVFLENSMVTSNDKNFVINCAVPRETVQQLIKKHLEQTAKKPAGK